MEKFVAAVLGGLVSRSVSFVVNTCSRQKGVEEYLQQLRGVLLRIQATVEEAEGRHITNQAMLRQLQMLREALYKGCYLLDNFTYRMQQQQRNNDQVSGHSFALSISSPDKRLCSSTRRMGVEFQGDQLKELQEMLRSLHSIMDDMAEFIVFLKSYPHISREPYNEYMFLEKCIFGRHAEVNKIISFLLKPESPGAESLQVLPIIGPPRVGKSTLVEHVCYDERVRNHFSSIMLCSGDPTAAPEASALVKKQTRGSHRRSLVVMELADGLVIDERECRKLYSSTSDMPPGSKVIITSRSDNILKFGTTGAIRLDFLSQEAYWYFFKVIAFGSTNPDDHPELASIAMEIAEDLDRSFLCANLCGGFLRANMDCRFWRQILELERNHVERNILNFGERPQTLVHKKQTPYVLSLSNNSMRLKVFYCQTHCPQNEVAKTTAHEVQTGSIESYRRRLGVLVWKSCILPYHSYTMICKMGAPAHVMNKKKRPHSMV
ncbi:unnamed protein product [Urochloa decumbens]|uniref:Disease resistance N-terminal domain-containing protein n=1 Tax=Urochloa decumbens TaxID=240449 RepID=A0ABC8YRF7_9POAL